MASMVGHRSAFKSPSHGEQDLPIPSSPTPPTMEPLSPARPRDPASRYPGPHDAVYQRGFDHPQSVRGIPKRLGISAMSVPMLHDRPHDSHMHDTSLFNAIPRSMTRGDAGRARKDSNSIADLADIALATTTSTGTSPGAPSHAYQSSTRPLSAHAISPVSHTDAYRPVESLPSDAARYPSTHIATLPDSCHPDDARARSRSSASGFESEQTLEDAALLLNFATRVTPVPNPAIPSYTQYARCPDQWSKTTSPMDTGQPLNGIHHYQDTWTGPRYMSHDPRYEPYADHYDVRRQSTDYSAVHQPVSGIVIPASHPEKPKHRRGWPKGKPRGPKAQRKSSVPTKTPAKTTKKDPKPSTPSAQTDDSHRRPSHNGFESTRTHLPRQTSTEPSALESKEPEIADLKVKKTRSKKAQVQGQAEAQAQAQTQTQTQTQTQAQAQAQETVCTGCSVIRMSITGEVEQWISCNGCNEWFHSDCAGFKTEREIKLVDKFFCPSCEPTCGPTTFVRKSRRAHTSVNYAGLNQGVIKTSDDCHEHHYIQPIKDGSFVFDPDPFPRIRPELATANYFAKMSNFTEPFLVPAEWNQHPLLTELDNTQLHVNHDKGHVADTLPDLFEYESAFFDGQDKLGMVIPQGLTVRQVCELVGPDYPLEVIDVKVQGTEGGKWNLGKWADYYEAQGEKAIRNVISLEVSQTKLGRLLRRPQLVRDIDLQDNVWPLSDNAADLPKSVAFYCLMSVADSYTDFHIDFGGSSVYYHILRGKKTFFFIPPKAKHLKAYEEWNNSPEQNFTFLPHVTKECYRVDLVEGDTMLIPSGWIHAVWTPENSLVIGGNFLTHMHLGMQLRVCDIERANKTPLKFRYPKFQKVMWYTVLKYLETDPLPEIVRTQLLSEGQGFSREVPTWQQFHTQDRDAPAGDVEHHVRYYSQMELDGLPDLREFIFRTCMIMLDRVDGITEERRKIVTRSMPKLKGEPLEVARTFALWVAWKRGNEGVPTWADANTPLPEKGNLPKKLSSRGAKLLQRQEAFENSSRRQSARVEAGAGPETKVVTTAGPDNSVGLPDPQPAVDKTKPSLGPKRVSCDPCRKRRIGCKHKSVSGPVVDTSESPKEDMKQSVTVDHAVEGADGLSDDTQNADGKRRGKACFECRKSKRRCNHDDQGNLDVTVNAQVKGGTGKKRKSSQVAVKHEAFDSIVTTNVPTDEPMNNARLDDEIVEHETIHQKGSIDSAISFGSNTKDTKDAKMVADIGSGTLEHAIAPASEPPVTNGSASRTHSTTPISPKAVRTGKQVKLSIPPTLSMPSSTIDEGSVKKRKASTSVSCDSPISPRTKKSKRSEIAEANGTGHGNSSSVTNDLHKVKNETPTLPTVVDEDEDESLRLARELAQESFSLRRRKSSGV